MCRPEMTPDDVAQACRQFMRWEDIDAYLRLYNPAIEADESRQAHDLRVGYMVLHEMVKRGCHSTYTHMQVMVCAELIWHWEHKDELHVWIRACERVARERLEHIETLTGGLEALIDAVTEYTALADLAAQGMNINQYQAMRTLEDAIEKARALIETEEE